MLLRLGVQGYNATQFVEVKGSIRSSIGLLSAEMMARRNSAPNGSVSTIRRSFAQGLLRRLKALLKCSLIYIVRCSARERTRPTRVERRLGDEASQQKNWVAPFCGLFLSDARTI
jgi:hypothetical protein